MRKFWINILICSVVLSLNCEPIIAAAMPEPTPATQTDKQKAAAAKKKEAERKKKEAEKKKKDAERAKAAKEKQKAADARKKETEKKRADAAKENEKKQAERDKAAAERAKVAEEREEAKAKKEAETKAKEEKAVRDYEKYQENLANPKTEVVSYFNLGLRAGYAAMMDKISPAANGSLWGAGTLNQKNALQQLKGGPGVGLDFTYNLEYGHFLFEVGLDVRFLNSTSAYGFTATRIDQTYNATYNYLFNNMRETRNMLGLGVPVMFGAQFSRYYFLLGAKIHYGLPMGYSQKGQYDIIVDDPALLEPYGLGIHSLNGQTNQPIKFKQPEISLAAEIGIDLDEWLQAQPDPKKKKAKIKPGQRLPFGREHVHYRVGLFAEYGVLNTNNTPAALPLGFNTTDVEPQNSNTMLAMNGDTKLNNLFVGAKFTIQFEVPGKKARPVPPPASYVFYNVVNEETEQPVEVAFIETRGVETDKIAMRERQIGPKGIKQRHAVGAFKVRATANGYYEKTEEFQIEKWGSTSYVTIKLKPCPVFRVRVTNKETGIAIPATVQIRQSGLEEPAYSIQTDSTNGAGRQMLAEGTYSLHIEQMGYEAIDMPIASIGDSMNVALTPVKKGEVFIVKNLFFATNKTRILSRSEEALNDLYMYLSRNPEVRIKIIGHTDSVGKDAANQKLSDGRANAVMNDLIERGIAADRLEAEGRGETQPIDTNDTDEGRQNNRRVEIEIL
ncbi:MAG: OmpA family protein [Paludibacteraceae bacterium]|nr:OmpA family protein [Paludibacteraceae bacterium]